MINISEFKDHAISGETAHISPINKVLYSDNYMTNFVFRRSDLSKMILIDKEFEFSKFDNTTDDLIITTEDEIKITRTPVCNMEEVIDNVYMDYYNNSYFLVSEYSFTTECVSFPEDGPEADRFDYEYTFIRNIGFIKANNY